MTHETTDVRNEKHLTFCVKCLDVDRGDFFVDNIKDVKMNDGKAETIFSEQTNVERFVAFGSDDCSTIIRKKMV